MIDPLEVSVAGNIGPHRTSVHDQLAGLFTGAKQPVRASAIDVQRQLTSRSLFSAPIPITLESAQAAYGRIMKEVGCSRVRDTVDERIVTDVLSRRFGQIVKSQNDVGGWPNWTESLAFAQATEKVSNLAIIPRRRNF